MNPSKFPIKNHVSKKGKRISQVLKGKFGFGLDTLDKALQGDQAALQSIGEAARQGRQVQELMPLLTEAYTTLIKGTEEYNKGIATILKQGATSAINIDKAASQTMLANQKYVNQRKELAAEFGNAKEAEKVRHQYAINYIQLKAYIDTYLTKVDNDAKLIDQSNRPEVKQLEENNRYELAAAKHLIQHGNNARLDLLPQREYLPIDGGQSTRKPSRGVMESVGRILSAFGLSLQQ